MTSEERIAALETLVEKLMREVKIVQLAAVTMGLLTCAGMIILALIK